MSPEDLEHAYQSASLGGGDPHLGLIKLGLLRTFSNVRPDIAQLLLDWEDMPDETCVWVSKYSCGILTTNNSTTTPLRYSKSR
jgi:hypothetical protein